ncbi:MAG: alpha-amylase family glycosyl hydrolase [Candidatus Dojkabacteria bacterium]
MHDYQWQSLAGQKPKKDIKKFRQLLGVQVTKRYQNGKAKTVEFKLYVKQKFTHITLVGPFNDWGKTSGRNYTLKPDKTSTFFTLKVSEGKIKHKTPYLFLVNGVHLRDPASVFFDNKGNSVFWDYDDPGTYQLRHNPPDKLKRSTRILQTDLPGLITHFRSKSGKLGWEIDTSDSYRFITESGVIKKIKDLGFNTIQFLPVARSIDGGKWSMRYLVPFLYSINDYWGDPDEFTRMIDTFHKHGIAVILDLVISHAPYKDFTIFNIPAEDIGIHHWKDNDDQQVFLGERTSWGTKRYRISDENIRRFVTDSAIHFIKHYRVDGFRIDNVDGILRKGAAGQGEGRPHAREFMRTFAETVYSYAPQTLLNYESHYFYKNNAHLLVAPLKSHKQALGATAYTSSRLTYYFHSKLMPMSSDEVSIWKFKDIAEEKEWGKSNSTVADFHNHDAAAGLMTGRATGSYAYDALLLDNPELHFHAIGKIKVMEALISYGAEGRTLDLLQTFLLQTGTFEHDSTIHWFLEQTEAIRGMLNFKRCINETMEDEAFWPVNTDKRQYINLDEASKTLVIKRSADPKDKHGFLIVINISSILTTDFTVPTVVQTEHKLILNSDSFEYSGSGRTHYQETFTPEKTCLFKYFKYGIPIEVIAPYAVLVFKY